MIEMDIAPEILKEAEQKAKEMGSLKGSVLKGKGNITGFIGEILISQLLNVPLQNTYDYDLIYNGIKIDVKSRAVNQIPMINYDCRICDFNPNQVCDYYCFLFVLKDYTKAWLVGFYEKGLFIKHANYEFQKTASDGTIMKEGVYSLDAYCIQHKKNSLNDIIYNN